MIGSEWRRSASRRFDQRLQDVARLPRLARELPEAAVLQQLAEVDVLVRHVAAEQLVAPLAVQQHGHLRLRQAHDAPLRVRTGRHDRLVLVPDHLVELLDEALRGRLRERGLGIDLGEHRVHVLALVDGVAVVDDREGLEPVAERHRVGHLRGQEVTGHAHDRRRVDAPGETGARGDIGHEAALDRLLEAGPELGRVRHGIGREGRRPVRLLVHPVGVDHRPRRRGEGADAGERGLRLVVVQAVEQVVVEPLTVGRRLELGIREHRFGLGGEEHAAGRRAGVVERLDAVVVARQHEPRRVAVAVAQVEEGERPHAVEAGEAVRPPLEVGVEDDLGVARGVERVAERLELRPQLAEVVDLAVVGELYRAVVGADGLVPTRGVDDGEPAVAEAGDRVLEEALTVGSPVRDPPGHGGEEGGVGRAPEPGNATHGRRSLQGRSPDSSPEEVVDSPHGHRLAPSRHHRPLPRREAPRAPQLVRGRRRPRVHRRVVG